ncbi:MAG: homogentisate 1,2-dioxygenase [Flavobacteriales bacterium]|nr:homogentisate 1,2-dioxygenase [Flavobacteriales bacterium]
MYHTIGKIPRKRHTVFRDKNGLLYHEELFGTEGFSGNSSLLYHIHPPTQIKEIKGEINVAPISAVRNNIQSRRIGSFEIPSEDGFLESRKILFYNDDLALGCAAPTTSMEEYFYKNANSDELLFVHEGGGVLKTQFGQIEFTEGDYLIIPRGVIYKIKFSTPGNRLLVLESNSPIVFPSRYRNRNGQLLEHAPYCERDFRLPSNLESIDQSGEFVIKIKKSGILHTVVYANHPFDVVGWDGYNFPYAFSIHDFEPITGSIHQPPPVHQTFEGNNFVVCSFCPRMFDYHPQAIPAPYNHSNIDSDEVLYYVDGDFMSRKNINKGDFTLHPAGIPHGPHPGTVEKSIGEKRTEELAVMVDPFRPFMLTQEAIDFGDDEYYKSWLK